MLAPSPTRFRSLTVAPAHRHRVWNGTTYDQEDMLTPKDTTWWIYLGVRYGSMKCVRMVYVKKALHGQGARGGGGGRDFPRLCAVGPGK